MSAYLAETIIETAARRVSVEEIADPERHIRIIAGVSGLCRLTPYELQKILDFAARQRLIEMPADWQDLRATVRECVDDISGFSEAGADVDDYRDLLKKIAADLHSALRRVDRL